MKVCTIVASRARRFANSSNIMLAITICKCIAGQTPHSSRSQFNGHPRLDHAVCIFASPCLQICVEWLWCVFYRCAGENSAMAERCTPRWLKILTTQSRRPMSAMSIIFRLCASLSLSGAMLEALTPDLYRKVFIAMCTICWLNLYYLSLLKTAGNSATP